MTAGAQRRTKRELLLAALIEERWPAQAIEDEGIELASETIRQAHRIRPWIETRWWDFPDQQEARRQLLAEVPDVPSEVLDAMPPRPSRALGYPRGSIGRARAGMDPQRLAEVREADRVRKQLARRSEVERRPA